MDKNCVEIFAEVLGLYADYVKREADDYSEGCFAKALEAMKIFGEQCFDAGRYYMTLDDRSMIPTLDYDEYLRELEEKK